MAHTRYKFIAPKSLGSQADEEGMIWNRKNYHITHNVGGLFGEGDADSLYRGVFFGHPFIVEIVGCDGDISCYDTSTPDLNDIIDDIRYDDGTLEIQGPGSIDDAPVSDMPDKMKKQLAAALLRHHELQYAKFVDEECDYPF